MPTASVHDNGYSWLCVLRSSFTEAWINRWTALCETVVASGFCRLSPTAKLYLLNYCRWHLQFQKESCNQNYHRPSTTGHSKQEGLKQPQCTECTLPRSLTILNIVQIHQKKNNLNVIIRTDIKTFYNNMFTLKASRVDHKVYLY